MSENPDPVPPNPTLAVNPSASSLAQLAAVEFTGPVAMLNLLRFEGQAGRTAYGRYAQVAAKSIAGVGGGLMYVGQVVEPSSWDTIALVYYPDVGAYLAMQHDKNYVNAIPDRTAGLEARLLYPFALPSVTGDEAAGLVPSSESNIIEAQLMRWKDPTPTLEQGSEADSHSRLSLKSAGVGLVTDGRWDELHLLPHSLGDNDLNSLAGLDPGVADHSVIVSKQTDQP